jgi:hypothetical protein
MLTPDGPDILAFTETFLDDKTPDNDPDLNAECLGYTLERRDRMGQDRGGILVYISNKLSPYTKVRKDLQNSDVESLWLDISPQNVKSLLVGIIYRKSSSLVSWYDHFDLEMQKASQEGKEIILLGDFNIDYLMQDEIPKQWKILTQSYDLHQLVTQPTRVTKNSKTCLDHVYTSNPESIVELNVPCYAISDHYPVCITKNNHYTTKKHVHTYMHYRDYKQFDENDFLTDLAHMPFHHIELLSDPNRAQECWYGHINQVVDKHAPSTCKRVKHQRQPEWFNDEIKAVRRQRDYYHKIKDWANYKLYRNKTKGLIYNAKKSFVNASVDECKDTKSVWKTLQYFTKKANSTYPLSIQVDNEVIDNPQEIAMTKNDYFTDIIKTIKPIMPENVDLATLCDYIKGKVPNKVTFSLDTVTSEDVYTLLSKLDTTKSTGLDGIGPRILKLSAHLLSSSLAHIFNLSISTGVFPDKLKRCP